MPSGNCPTKKLISFISMAWCSSESCTQISRHRIVRGSWDDLKVQKIIICPSHLGHESEFNPVEGDPTEANESEAGLSDDRETGHMNVSTLLLSAHVRHPGESPRRRALSLGMAVRPRDRAVCWLLTLAYSLLSLRSCSSRLRRLCFMFFCLNISPICMRYSNYY